jgi:hypothetical protein
MVDLKYISAMNIKELLLNGQSFSELLRQFAINVDDVRIQDENVILADQNLEHKEIVKESICIEGKNKEGVVNFFGTLHYNLLSKLAVFEMQGFEQVSRPQVI